MLQDIRRGKRTEIDSISGAVVRAARDAEVPAPVNGWLLEQVAAMEQRSRSVPGPVAGLSGKQSGRA
jgi:2-dehydropantoate 2-reductase